MVNHFNCSSYELLEEESALKLPKLEISDALKIGENAKLKAMNLNLPLAVEVRIGEWMVYHASLPGSSIDNQLWLDRKARVVILKHHSTLFERISAHEKGIDWYLENNLNNDKYAIHGGGLPLIIKDKGFVGVFLISGLPQVEDHIFGVEVLKEYLFGKN